ncbi:MAG TPA: hypothetical protein VFZ95_07065 [Steroidobacteraceae bacterium]
MSPASRITPILFCVLCARVCADEATQENPGEAPQSQTTGSRFRDPQDGKFDLSKFLAQPRAFLPVPLIVTEPAVGYGGGVAGMFVRPRKDAGSEGFARPNMSVAGGLATENGTWMAFAGDSSHWLDERLQTLAAFAGGQLNLDFYGLGDASDSLDQAVSYELDFSLALIQGNWKPKAKSPWSLGMRYIYSKVEPKLDDDPLFPGLADRIAVTISAPAAILEYDSRDNLFTPTRGIFSESLYLLSREELGASEDFERFQQVVMGWIPLGEDWTLGMRGDYQWSSDGTPFFLRPYIKLRGVAAMRYQGDEMASAEVEARWQFRPRWSLVGATGYGTAHTDRALFSATRDVWSGALGFRYQLARLFGMHAGVDVGVSDGETAIYLQVGSAWFRP